MSESGRTPFYGIPYPNPGDIITGADEKAKAEIVENQMRGGIIAQGAVRVFDEGNYSLSIDGSNNVTVVLSGGPSIRGLANFGFIESYQPLTWATMTPGSFYYLYILANNDIYRNPSSITAVVSTSPHYTYNYLFLATLDNRLAGSPILNTSPAGKPTGQNLFDFLNSGVDPFGLSLTQQNIVATISMMIALNANNSVRISQTDYPSTSPLMSLENSSLGPDINGVSALSLAVGLVKRLSVDINGRFGLNTNPDTLIQFLLNITDPSLIGLVVKMALGQTADAVRCEDSTGATVFSLDANSRLNMKSAKLIPQATAPTAVQGGMYMGTDNFLYVCLDGATWVKVLTT